jgi:hypothetical protein
MSVTESESAVEPTETTAAADAAAVTGGEPVAEAGAATEAPATPPTIDWNSPEAQQAFESYIQQREQQAQWEAQQAAETEAQQGQFANIEEAFQLLGISPDQLQAYFSQFTAPFQPAIQQFQAQQAWQQVNGYLSGDLATQHPDLLGQGVDALADLTTEDGKPLFNPGEIKTANERAILMAAAGAAQAAQQEGYGNVDTNQLLAFAAEQVRQRDETVGKIAVERYKRELQNAAGAATDVTGTGGQGIPSPRITEGDELAYARAFLAGR